MDVRNQINRYFSLLREWNATYEEYAKSVGLSYTQLLILHTIHDTENCTQKVLCDICFLPKQTVNIAVTAFYKQGLVTLEESPNDRRTKTILFTPKGEEFVQSVLTAVKRDEIAAMNALSPDQRTQLLDLTEKYVRNCMENLQKLTKREA